MPCTKKYLQYKSILYILSILLLLFCFPTNSSAGRIKQNGSVYSVNGFTCDTSKANGLGSPCIINVNLDNLLATNGSAKSRLKYTKTVKNASNSDMVVFCVEHGKSNPDDGASCLLKYENYDKYVLAGLGEIISASNATKLTRSNIKSKYQKGYVDVALAQNNLLQTLGYYQDSENYYRKGIADVNKWANIGLYSAFYYYNYAQTNFFDLDLSFDKNNNLRVNINKKDMKLKRGNKTIITGKTAANECYYTIKYKGTNGTEKTITSTTEDKTCKGLNSLIKIDDLNSSDRRINVSVTLKKNFHLASLYDCSGQDVTLAKVKDQKLEQTHTKSITPTPTNTPVAITIEKTDSDGNPMEGVYFTATKTRPRGDAYQSIKPCRTGSDGKCTITGVESGVNYYIFEGYYWPNSSCKYNGYKQYVFFSSPLSQYAISKTTYSVNGSEPKIPTMTVRAVWESTTCDSSSSHNINPKDMLTNLPVFQITPTANTTIKVTNPKVNACQETLQTKSTSTEIENVYQEYLNQGKDYRKILDFRGPKCENTSVKGKELKTSCLNISNNYLDDYLEKEANNSSLNEFTNFNANNLSSYEEILTGTNNERAYCKSEYELLPSANTQDLNPVKGGQMYFKLNSRGEIMSGTFTRICYVAGSVGENKIEKEAFKDKFRNGIKNISLPNAKLINNEKTDSVINLTPKIDNANTNYTVENVTDNSSNYNFVKLVYEAAIYYSIPQIFSNLNGEIVKDCKNGSCISLGYGIASPISTKKGHTSGGENEEMIYEENSTLTSEEISSLDEVDFYTKFSGTSGSSAVVDPNFDSMSEDSDSDGVVEITENLTEEQLENLLIGSNTNVQEISVPKYNSDNSFLSGSPIESKYTFSVDGVADSSSSICTYKYIPQLLCENGVCLDFRIVDSENPFVDKNGASRKTMSNWCYESCDSNNTNVRKYITNATNSYGIKKTEEGTEEKKNPKYKIVLNQETISNIKKIAKEKNLSYSKFEFDKDGHSQLLNELKTSNELKVTNN